jgi:hypothetical protein
LRSGHAGRRPRITSGTAALLVAVGGVAVGVLLFVAVLNVMGSGRSGKRADTDLFVLGQATPLAASVARQGPLLLQDPLGRGRDVYVQHLGGGDWRTFDAHPPDAPGRCLINWRAARHGFVDACSDRVFPPDGTGLTTFPTSVDGKGRVLVDLRHPRPPDATTTTAALSSPPS